MIISPTITLLAVAPLTSITVFSNLLDVCQGFTALTKYRPVTGSFIRTLPTLRFKEDDDTVGATSPEAVAEAILQGEVILPSLDDGGVATMLHGPGILEEEAVLDVPNKLTGESLHPISFEDDIEKFLDIAKPYYALENEFAIVDDATGDMVGFVCTGRVEIPVSRESGGIPVAEAGRHMAAAGSVAALLRNPQKKRFHYPASQYHWECHSYQGRVKEELAKINGGHQFSAIANDPIIFARCTDFSKRTATSHILLENDDATWESNVDYSLVSAMVFKKMYPPPVALPVTTKSPRDTFGNSSLMNVKSFSDITGQWLTMEASLPPCKSEDCLGHFYDNPTYAHSAMLFHNCDLIGKALSEFTGTDLPFKKSDFGQEPGMKMLSWECLPENLHFPNTYGLKLQSRVFLSKGELGKPGSTYTVQSEVKQEETGVVCYKATGSFILEPVKFLKAEFRRAIGNKDFDLLWDKLDVNGDGVVSREELQQFVASSGMAELDDKEFDILFDSIDEDKNGELSFDEISHYFNSLHNDIKQDFGDSIAIFLEDGSPDEVTALWSKLDIDGDGVVTREELSLFVTSEKLSDVTSEDAQVLHQDIDTNGDGVVDFGEFQAYLYSLKLSHDYAENNLVCVPDHWM